MTRSAPDRNSQNSAAFGRRWSQFAELPGRFRETASQISGSKTSDLAISKSSGDRSCTARGCRRGPAEYRGFPQFGIPRIGDNSDLSGVALIQNDGLEKVRAGAVNRWAPSGWKTYSGVRDFCGLEAGERKSAHIRSDKQPVRLLAIQRKSNYESDADDSVPICSCTLIAWSAVVRSL